MPVKLARIQQKKDDYWRSASARTVCADRLEVKAFAASEWIRKFDLKRLRT